MQLSKFQLAFFLMTGYIGISTYFPLQNQNDHIFADDQSKVFVFDLGGVLVKTDSIKTLSYIGLKDTLFYMIKTRTSPRAVKKKLWHFMDAIYVHLPHELKEKAVGNTCQAVDEDQHIMPHLMCDWLKGTLSCAEIREFIFSHMQKPIVRQFFSSNLERKLAKRIANIIFTPKYMASTRGLIKQGVELVKECKKRGHKVYVLSNWDPESFALVREKHKEFFALFDGIIISGDLKYMKPEKEIYHVVQKLFDNKPCVFIDDQKQNIEAANMINNITGIHCTSKHWLLGLANSPQFAPLKTTYLAEKDSTQKN